MMATLLGVGSWAGLGEQDTPGAASGPRCQQMPAGQANATSPSAINAGTAWIHRIFAFAVIAP
jgi:hypothetical protein